MTEKFPECGKHELGEELIRKAFAVAQASGTPGWQTMTIAVLKNRLLDITDRSFKESDWGAETFGAFLSQFGDVITVDPATHPPRATLRGEASVPSPDGEPEDGSRDIGPRRRVRSDLWSVVLDYSGARTYLWEDGKVVTVEPGRAGAGAKVLPSLTKAEFKSWRSEFVDRKSEESPGAEPFLRSWLEREQPLATLPPEFRIPWVVELKRRVLSRLEDWFNRNGISPPVDLVVGDEEPPGAERAKGADALREHVLAAVGEMTDAELEALQLPASVMLRVKR